MTQSIQETVATSLSTMSLDLDLKGGGTWAPQRDPKQSYARWGTWEAWCFFKFGKINECLVGPVATGDWVAWNSDTKQLIGFTKCERMSAQEQAELMCASQNQGKPTRVIDITGRATASKCSLQHAERLLGDAVREFDAARTE